jgi:hypothetical protein
VLKSKNIYIYIKKRKRKSIGYLETGGMGISSESRRDCTLAKRTDEEYIGHDMSWRRALGVHCLKYSFLPARVRGAQWLYDLLLPDKLLVGTMTARRLAGHWNVDRQIIPVSRPDVFIFPRNRPVPA